MKVRYLVAVAVLILAGLFGVEARARFSADLASARVAADSARHTADAAVARAQAAEAFADANQILVAQAEKERRDAQASAAAWKSRYAIAAAVAPETCKTIVIAADSTIAESERAAAASEAKATLLQASLDSVKTAVAVIVPATVNLSNATARLETASRPSLFSRLLPRTGFGLAAGVDATGRPTALIGFTLSWTK